MRNEIIVIGAGASGCMAAITAARANCQVLVLEKNSIIGKKILATGNGRCNYSNEKMGESFFRGEDPSFISAALSKFSVRETIAFFKELGIYPKSKEGYLYPLSREASSVRAALEMEMERLGIKVIYDSKVTDIKNCEGGYEVYAGDKKYTSDKLIITAGGFASPSSGSDGAIFEIVKNLGIGVSEPAPALVPVKCKSKYLKKLSGVRAECSATLLSADESGVMIETAHREGEVQFADYGLSGIVIFDLSRYVSKNPERTFVIKLNFLPDFDEAELRQIISSKMHNEGEKISLAKAFNGFLPAKLLEVMDERINGSYTEDNIYNLFTAFDFSCKGTLDFTRAQVTAGGILLSELTEGFEAKNNKGLYLAGEILDVDGICGGYNLQWAWTSGYLAGLNSANN